MSQPNQSAKSKRARATTKARNALDAHRLAVQQRREADKMKREQLETAARAEKALEIVARREQLRKQEAAIRGRLGRAVLDNILHNGLQGILLTADEVHSWPSDHRELLNIVIAARSAVATQAAADGESGLTISALDIEV